MNTLTSSNNRSNSRLPVSAFRVVYSELFREDAKQLLARARAKGKLNQIVQAIKDIHKRLEWIPLDFGEPLVDLVQLGIQRRIGTIAPLVATFGVDEANRLVYVLLPFKLLPNSGL